jgi:hypothetical protein
MGKGCLSLKLRKNTVWLLRQYQNAVRNKKTDARTCHCAVKTAVIEGDYATLIKKKLGAARAVVNFTAQYEGI